MLHNTLPAYTKIQILDNVRMENAPGVTGSPSNGYGAISLSSR